MSAPRGSATFSVQWELALQFARQSSALACDRWGSGTRQKLVLGARIVLLSGDGLATLAIMAETDKSKTLGLALAGAVHARRRIHNRLQHLDAERGAARQLKRGADIDERVRQPPRPRSLTPAIRSEARIGVVGQQALDHVIGPLARRWGLITNDRSARRPRSAEQSMARSAARAGSLSGRSRSRAAVPCLRFPRRSASPCQPRAPVPSSGSANVQSSFPPARPRLSRRRWLAALMVTHKIQRGCGCRHCPSPPTIHRSSASGHPQPLYHPPGQDLRAGPRHSHWSADRRLPASRFDASNFEAAGPTSSLGQVAGCRARLPHPRHGSLPRVAAAGVSAG
jgi:hypothetical protein